MLEPCKALELPYSDAALAYKRAPAANEWWVMNDQGKAHRNKRRRSSTRAWRWIFNNTANRYQDSPDGYFRDESNAIRGTPGHSRHRSMLEGYELLFRDSIENRCPPGDPDVASKKTIDTAVPLGLETLSESLMAFPRCFRQKSLWSRFWSRFDPRRH
jgi:hypothetical protein